MRLNLVGPFTVNAPFGTEIAFAKGLRQIGHEVIEVDPNISDDWSKLDGTADATVVFKNCVGHEFRLGLLPRQHPVIVYQPDDARFPHIRKMMLEMRQYSDMFLSFDDHGARLAKSMGYRAAETLLLTADPDLYRPDANVERDIDISFVGSMGDTSAHSSRRYMCTLVSAWARERGLKTWFGEAYFDGRSELTPVQIYQRSKVVLNHATDVGQTFGLGYGLQCRHFEVGMTRTCLLSNTDMSGLHPTKAPAYVVFGGAEALLRQIEFLLEDHDYNWQGCAGLLYDSVMEHHLPRHRAEDLVAFIERNT